LVKREHGSASFFEGDIPYCIPQKWDVEKLPPWCTPIPGARGVHPLPSGTCPHVTLEITFCPKFVPHVRHQAALALAPFKK